MKNWCIIRITRSLFPILFLLVSLSARGQNGDLLKLRSSVGSEGVNIGSAIDLQEAYIRDLYSEKIEAPKELINGKEYEPYYTRSKNKPLLFFDKSRTASILTKTRRYNNLTLQYDTFLDEVIYTDTSRTINSRFPQIALNKNILEGFNLYFQDDSLIFKYFRLSEYPAKNLKEGFYEVVYEGKSKYIIRHKSSFYVREGMNEYKYSRYNYISTGDIFYEIKTRKNLLRLFGEKSSDMKEYLHSSGIKVRKADKSQLLHIVKFYDSLVASKR
jgi:hypothetical protein